jgi:hypothetical protein
MLVEARGPTPPLRAGQGQAAPRAGLAALLPFFDSLWSLDSVFVTENY